MNVLLLNLHLDRVWARRFEVQVRGVELLNLHLDRVWARRFEVQVRGVVGR